MNWQSKQTKINIAGLTVIAISLSGCFTNQTLTSSNAITVNTLALPSSPRAVRIVFQTGSSGSFNTIGAQGTAPGYGNGLQAVQVFDPTNNNTVIASGGPTSTNWPNWLVNFELGISGSNNPQATNSSCARFAAPSEIGNCVSNGSTTNWCSAQGAQFRVSEADCAQTPPAAGVGDSTDGIYFRATFSRDPTILGPTENIMVVVEYAASSFYAAPKNPSTCFTNAQGGFTPENCADFSWKAFLRSCPSNAACPTQPFLMFIPPTPYYMNGATPGISSANLVSKQFILPLASNQNINEVQFSRIGSSLSSSDTTFTNACATGFPANSPLCAGLVISSVTFYRI